MDGLLNALREKVDQAEVYHLKTQAIPIEFRSGRLESVKIKQTEGMALRVLSDDRLGFATTTDMKDPSELIASAIASAAFGEKSDFSFPAETDHSHPDVYDHAIADISEEELIKTGEEAIARLHDAEPEADLNVTINKVIETVAISNTAGCNLEEKRTHLSLGIEARKTREGDIFTIFAEGDARFNEDLSVDPLVDRLIHYFAYGKNIVPAPAKKLPVVFTPQGAITLLLPLIIGFNGKSVYMGTSPLKGRIGEELFDPRFSLADDGTLPRGPRSSGFDDEGTPTVQTPLASNGIIKGFLYDLRTAALAGTAPTGNGYKGGLLGRGGFRTPQSVGIGNILVSVGDKDEDGIIARIEEGLIVDSVLGLGQGNITTGEFSNNVAVAFKIEKGKIVGRVKNTMIAGNTYNLLREHLIALGDRAQWVHGTVRTPMIAVDQVNVVGQRG
ncbi:MAG: TldD/PmbA family protein [Candidatus Bipolaricaulota bacterium]|nr:TldD/PmbA family protein [Candidatus Bipolaricaulota bacterium]